MYFIVFGEFKDYNAITSEMHIDSFLAIRFVSFLKKIFFLSNYAKKAGTISFRVENLIVIGLQLY